MSACPKCLKVISPLPVVIESCDCGYRAPNTGRSPGRIN